MKARRPGSINYHRLVGGPQSGRSRPHPLRCGKAAIALMTQDVAAQVGPEAFG